MGDKLPGIKFRKEKVAPEGGWGILCGIGFTLPFACGLGSLHSFGLMFNDFLAQLGAEASEVTLITGVFFCTMSFAALGASLLFKKFSLRCVGLLGAAIYFAGSLLTIFITSVQMLLVSYGLLQGLGTGLMMPVGYTNFNRYFIKKRIFMMSVTQALKGVLIVMHPILVNFAMNEYGFRGTLAIIAAINSHAIFGMLVQHPIEWHYKVIKVPVHELKPLMENETNVTVQTQPPAEQEMKTIETNQITRKVELTKSFEAVESGSLQNPMSSRVKFNKMGIRYGTLSVVKQAGKKLYEICRAKIVEFLDLTLLKDMIYVNLIIGVSAGLFSDNVFTSVLPLYLKSLGFSIDESATIVSVGTGADMVSRLALVVLTFYLPLKARHIFLGGAISLLIVRFVFLQVYSFVGMMAVMVGIGFFRTWLHVPLALTFAEYLPPERFASGYGLFMFLRGNWDLLFGPVTGWIRDVTQSYVIFFCLLQFFMFTCAVPWLIEMVWMKTKSKRR